VAPSHQSWVSGIARWLLVIAGCYLLAALLHRTEWYRELLCARVLQDPSPSREQSAHALARVGGEDRLFELLQHPKAPVREAARTALDALWFGAEGASAARQLLAATEAINDERYDEALARLDELIQRRPRYAEALNRRASLHWQLGRPGASIRDCERALEVNPRHYGAWQGLGLCHLHLGNNESARNCLQMYLQLQPHDTTAREWLQQCDGTQGSVFERSGGRQTGSPPL
jgi:tetratricopeptide (TPR) repeat protein